MVHHNPYPSLFTDNNDDPTNRLKISAACSFAGFETMNDKVLKEMNERAKSIMTHTELSPAKPVNTTALAAAAAVSRTSPRNVRHKRFSSIHRKVFSKMSSIESHFSVRPETDAKDNGKRVDKMPLSSPAKRRRMDPSLIVHMTGPRKVSEEAQVVNTTKSKRISEENDKIKPGRPSEERRSSSGRSSGQKSSREDLRVGIHVAARNDVSWGEPPQTHRARFARNKLSTEDLSPPEVRLRHSVSARSLRTPAKVDRLLKTLPELPPGQATAPHQTERMLRSLPSTTSLPKLLITPAGTAIGNSPSMRSIKDQTHSSSLSSGSRIPRSTTLQSMKSIDNMKTPANSAPKHIAAERLLRAKTMARSSPNLKLQTSAKLPVPRPLPRPPWR
jgi:hypothetical protein